MTSDRAIFVLETEKKCVLRNIRGCDRNCEFCDLVLPDDDILTAFNMAIEALKGDDGK